MIHKFNQFINENNHQGKFSIHNQINEPFTTFIERVQERIDMFIVRVGELLNEMDRAIETTMEEFGDIIVKEPNFKVDRDMSVITAEFYTNIPNNDESWETDESPAQDLEYKLNNWFGEFKNVRTEIGYKANDEGNCIIELSMYVLDIDHFGSETIDAIQCLGEE